MSHVTTGKMRIMNLADVEIAAKKLGGRLVRNQETHNWYGKFLNDWESDRAAITRGFDPLKFGRCEHAIVLDDATKRDYEIGLVQHHDGRGYEAVYDAYGVHGDRLEKAFGVGLVRLKEETGVQATIRTYRKKGYRVEDGRTTSGKREVRVWAKN